MEGETGSGTENKNGRRGMGRKRGREREERGRKGERKEEEKSKVSFSLFKGFLLTKNIESKIIKNCLLTSRVF